MSDPFVHLRVASGYSLQYGASAPSELVQRAADHEMDILGLTDRDGLYGAIRFAKACLRAGIAPVLGVDLAVQPTGPQLRPRKTTSRTPTRGGVERDAHLPRVVVLAGSRAGWAALCRLVSSAHLGPSSTCADSRTSAPERGKPVVTAEQIAGYAAGGELVVLLGADSELGSAVTADRVDLAEQRLLTWQGLVPELQLVVGVTNQQVCGTGPGSAAHAGRMLKLADHAKVPAVITNAVRMADRHQAPTVDVLDCARRLVPLDVRHVDRRNAEGYLKSGKEMLQVADEVATLAGRGTGGGERLVWRTRQLALRCQLDPRADIGLGEIHLPELSVLKGAGSGSALGILRNRCEAGISRRYGQSTRAVTDRLDDELDVVGQLGFGSYFLTVADIVDLIADLGVRCAARGSGAGSLINYLLGVSGVDPLRHGLLMERFLSPLRRALPDVDIDVESARRMEVYDKILDSFGGDRVACVAMLDTYRVRHAVRDVGAALSMPPAEIDAMAKAFPHIRASDARSALRDLPELRAAGLAERRLDLFFDLVESLDGLPRHLALHPCGVLLSDSTLLDRTPVQASHDGYPMSQFDKDDVEDIGLLKLDVLGIRMQSSMAHALTEIDRTVGEKVDLDAVGFDDPDTFELIRSTDTLGCFQIESPGQRELIGKFGPDCFGDIIIDISLFRPGPVKSDMIVPFLNARHGWALPQFLHPDLEPYLRETGGVVVFHEQVIQIIARIGGCSLAEADKYRRAPGDRDGKEEVRNWFFPTARTRGYDPVTINRIWEVLEAFASFGFCKAHAAAFALPTYQSAWLKAHWPAHFLAGILTHDPGMYPKRLLVEEVRRWGIEVLGLDVNASTADYRVELVGDHEPLDDHELGRGWRDRGRGYGIRISLAEVKGINDTEVARIVAGRPYQSLTDFWRRAGVSGPVVERLILAGAFDTLYRIGAPASVLRRRTVTRRDLLLGLADLHRDAQADARAAARARGLRRTSVRSTGSSTEQGDPRDRAKAQSMASAQVRPQEVQLALDFSAAAADQDQDHEDQDHDKQGPDDLRITGLPEMSDAERTRAELGILGLDVSRHVVDYYRPMLTALGITWSTDLLSVHQRAGVLIGGVKVATQTPPIRTGKRVVFLTVDDGTGPADATFFEDAQGPYAATLFSSWLLLVQGELRRTGRRGVSLRATGCWDLTALHTVWTQTLDLTGDQDQAVDAVRAVMAVRPEGFGMVGDRELGRRRVLVHASGFQQSPYADIAPPGIPVAEQSRHQPDRKVWHTSQGNSGR
ncbi:MAG: DNA polymerase III subunit alpha [Propionibacteriaceae bacterium]